MQNQGLNYNAQLQCMLFVQMFASSKLRAALNRKQHGTLKALKDVGDASEVLDIKGRSSTSVLDYTLRDANGLPQMTRVFQGNTTTASSVKTIMDCAVGTQSSYGSLTSILTFESRQVEIRLNVQNIQLDEQGLAIYEKWIGGNYDLKDISDNDFDQYIRVFERTAVGAQMKRYIEPKISDLLFQVNDRILQTLFSGAIPNGINPIYGNNATVNISVLPVSGQVRDFFSEEIMLLSDLMGVCSNNCSEKIKVVYSPNSNLARYVAIAQNNFMGMNQNGLKLNTASEFVMGNLIFYRDSRLQAYTGNINQFLVIMPGTSFVINEPYKNVFGIGTEHGTSKYGQAVVDYGTGICQDDMGCSGESPYPIDVQIREIDCHPPERHVFLRSIFALSTIPVGAYSTPTGQTNVLGIFRYNAA